MPQPTELSAPSQTASRVRFKVMAFLCVLSFLTYFDRVCMMRAKQSIVDDLGLSTQSFGYILSAFWLAYALFEIPSGWIGDRTGARRTLTRIVLAWSVFTALSGAATGFTSLLLYRFLFGVGEAGAYPNMARIQAHWLPAQSRARAGGLLWLLARWGGAFSPVIFGSMLRLFDSTTFREGVASVPIVSGLAEVASWRLTFFVAGALGFVWCVWFFVWFRDDPREKSGVNDAELRLITGEGSPAAEKHAPPPDIWRRLFTCRSLWAMGLLYLAGSFGWSFFVSYMQDYFLEVHHTKYDRSEWMSAMPLLCGGISCLVGGTLCDYLVRATGNRWLGRAVFPFFGYSVAAVSMLLLRNAQTPWHATLLLTIASAGFDFAQGANWATIVDIGGKYAGVATGFVNLVGNMGNVLQPIVGAKIIEYFSWSTLFTCFACAYLFAASMWWFIDPTRRFYDDRQASGT